MKTAKARITGERPYLKAEWYSVVPDEELQTAYDVLFHIHIACGDPNDWKLAIHTFLSLTDELLAQHSPPFRGGQEWDNRKVCKEEWR